MLIELASKRSENKDGIDKEKEKDVTYFCAQHIGEIFRFTCEQCYRDICRECALTEHQEHPRSDLNSSALHERLREEAIVALSQAKARARALDIASKAAEHARVDMLAKRQQLEAEVGAAIQRIRQVVDLRETALLREVNEICQKKALALGAQAEQLHNSFLQVNSACESAERGLSKPGAVASVLKALREMYLPERPMLPEHSVADVSFFSAADNALLQDIARTGRIIDSATVPLKCTTSGDGLRAAITNVRNVFTVQARDTAGTAVKRGGDLFRADIKGPGECALQLTDEGDGTYTVSFVPGESGAHVVSVFLRDMHIAGSPFSVRVIAPSFAGQFVRRLGAKGKGDDQFDHPDGVAVSPLGELYVCDEHNHRIQVFRAADGTHLRNFGSHGTGSGQFHRPCDIAIAYSREVYVCDNGNHRISVFDPSGTFLFDFGGKGAELGYFDNPWAVAVSPAGEIFVCDWGNRRIQVFDNGGVFLRSFSHRLPNGPSLQPTGIVVSLDYQVFVADSASSCIHVFQTDGQHLRTFGSEGQGDGQLCAPRGMAVSSDNTLFVCDGKNHRIQAFRADGKFLGKFGGYGSAEGLFSGPMDVCCLPDGRLVVSEWSTHRVQLFE